MASITKRSYWTTLPDGRKERRTCEHYVIEYRDPATGRRRRVKGYKNKQATKQLAANLEWAAARGEQDLTDPYAVHKARPLTEHIAAFLADLRAAGGTEKYIDNLDKRLAILSDACGWRTLADVEPNSFMRWRERQKKQKRNGVEKSWEGTSASTLNQYLDMARAFLNWCVKPGKRIVANPLADISKVAGPVARRRCVNR